MQLNPVEYDMRIDEFPGINLPEGKQIGFIAQELEKVVPNVVHDKIISGFADNGEYNEMEEFYKYDVKTVDYTSLIPVLTKAIQEQQEMIESQNAKIAELEKTVNELKNK